MERKTVLITGASSGLGLCLARALTQQGHRVIGTARNEDRLREMVRECPNLFFPMLLDVADTTSPQVWEQAFRGQARVEHIDTLLVNAAVHLEHEHDYPGLDYKEWPHASILQKTWAVNYFGAVRSVEAFLPLVKGAADGRILFTNGNLGSFYWHHHPTKAYRDMLGFHHPEYSASKAGLNLRMVHLARQEPALFVASLNPGWIDTKIGGQAKGNMKPRPVESALPHFLKYTVGEIDRSRSGSFIDTKDADVPW